MAVSTNAVAKRSVKFLFGMSTLMLGANLVWVAYTTVLLPTMIENILPNVKGLAVGVIGFFGTLLALLVSILWGIISDHTTSKLGKRTPAILTGALIAVPLIALPALLLHPMSISALVPLALPILLVSYLGMQFSTNMSNGAWWPLLVDIVPENQRGLASGIQGFLTLLGSALGIVVITTLNQNGHTGAAFWLLAGAFALTGLVNVWVIRGKDTPARMAEKVNVRDAMADMFKVRTRVVVFFWLVLAMLLANMGINSLQSFARYFFEVYFPSVSPDAAFRYMGGISLLFTMLSAVACGLISDRVGRRAIILLGLVLCTICTLLMGFTTNFSAFLVLAALRAIASGPILSTAPALASDLSPKDEAGQYMAYNNLSTGLSGGIAALIGGILLVNMTRTSFMFFFIITAIFFMLGAMVFATRVSQKELEEGLEVVEEAGGVA